MSGYSLRSKRLKNVKTVARDNLANERTFLAWLRTSIVCVSIGIALAQLLRFTEQECQVDIGSYTVIIEYGNSSTLSLGKPFAVVCIVLGIITLITGFVRFYYAENMLTEGYYPMSSVSAFIAVAMVSIVTVLYVIVTAKVIF